MARRGILLAALLGAAAAAAAEPLAIDPATGVFSVDGEPVARAAWPAPEALGAPAVEVSDVVDGAWRRVRLTWEPDRETPLDELSVPVEALFGPDFWWTPHLSPRDGDCAAQHVLRSPALIAAKGGRVLTLIPDLDLCGKTPGAPWFLDLDAPRRTLTVGMSLTSIYTHVLYEKKPGMALGPGTVQLGFYAALRDAPENPVNPWHDAARFLWRRHGHPLFEKGEPLTVPMDAYVRHTYAWAFDTWKDAVWQEFDLDGRRVGAPAFIVNVTQSPNHPGPVDMREFLSIWNQAWFSSLRGASGVLRFARRTNDAALAEKAMLTKELALAAPMTNGLFPGVYGTKMEKVEVDGKKVNRSKGWATGRWMNSNRVPWERGVTDQWFHVLDASWTCLLMLRWHGELDPDPRLLDYARAYGDRLLTLQDEKGLFPAWLHPETQKPHEILRDSPESSMSATFLLKLADVTGKAKYRDAALRALDALLADAVPQGRWEDFETFWSCCGWGREEFVGRKIPRNALHKQCSFSMFWTAEALLAAHRATGDARWLAWGRRTLDELSMLQQAWQPPFIHIPALGGFGVMNCDGEWNDSRQCLFAGLFLDYYRATGEAELFERGVAALKSSFVMMYCPENPRAKRLWEKVWPFFGPEDHGFTMENYGHGGATGDDGEGIGEFTIYDWGNGAAAEARNRIRDHYGDVYLDPARGLGFGVDSVRVTPAAGGGFTLENLSGTPRDVLIVRADGPRGEVRLETTLTVEGSARPPQ